MNINFNYPPIEPRSDFLKEVVTFLIKRRKELGITQDDLNYKLGMSDRHLSKWECGMKTPTVFHLYCWADALDCKLTIIANDNDPEYISDAIERVSNDNVLQCHCQIKKCA